MGDRLRFGDFGRWLREDDRPGILFTWRHKLSAAAAQVRALRELDHATGLRLPARSTGDVPFPRCWSQMKILSRHPRIAGKASFETFRKSCSSVLRDWASMSLCHTKYALLSEKRRVRLSHHANEYTQASTHQDFVGQFLSLSNRQRLRELQHRNHLITPKLRLLVVERGRELRSASVAGRNPKLGRNALVCTESWNDVFELMGVPFRRPGESAVVCVG